MKTISETTDENDETTKAVRESRRQKQEAARKIAGMTHAEIIAFFRKVREEYGASQAARREAVFAH